MPQGDWSIVLVPATRRELQALPVDARGRVARAIDGLAAQPRPPGSKLLVGQADTRIWRVRVGDYRVLCEIRESELVVVVVGIGHRRDVYRGR